MKVLVLTNPEHIMFVRDVIAPYNSGHDIHCQFLGKATFPFIHYDIGISFMHQYKVPAKEVSTHPWFNFHPAPLPEYKGRDLCYHAIMNGEKEFGATLHYMDENFDTGDIIHVQKFSIRDDYTAEDVSIRAIETSRVLFKVYLPRILETRVFPRLPNVGGTYYEKGSIVEEMPLQDAPLSRWIRAVTYKNFYPKIDIGGVKYKIAREG